MATIQYFLDETFGNKISTVLFLSPIEIMPTLSESKKHLIYTIIKNDRSSFKMLVQVVNANILL